MSRSYMVNTVTISRRISVRFEVRGGRASAFNFAGQSPLWPVAETTTHCGARPSVSVAEHYCGSSVRCDNITTCYNKFFSFRYIFRNNATNNCESMHCNNFHVRSQGPVTSASNTTINLIRQRVKRRRPWDSRRATPVTAVSTLLLLTAHNRDIADKRLIL